VRSLAQLTPVFLGIVLGAVIGAVGAAWHVMRIQQEPIGANTSQVTRSAMIGGIVGANVGVVATVVLLRRRRL
jgi:hypothetical protein